jgi:hypothetical protein
MNGLSRKSGLERGTVDQQLSNAIVDDLLFGQVGDDVPQPNLIPTGYNLRTRNTANPNIDFDELLHQRTVSKQRQLAATWSNTCKTLQSRIISLRTNVYT